MNTSQRITHILMAICAMAVMGTAALAADPGLTYPINSAVSDQKAGSVLIYTVYTSSAPSPNTQNTRINITNTSTTSAAFVHLFFVEGATCSVSDRNVCLTASPDSDLPDIGAGSGCHRLHSSHSGQRGHGLPGVLQSLDW